MLDLQPLREHADRCTLPIRKTFNGEQGLMLVWLDSCLTRCFFAEVQKTANLITKIRQGLVINWRPARASLRHLAHLVGNYIVTRYYLQRLDLLLKPSGN